MILPDTQKHAEFFVAKNSAVVASADIQTRYSTLMSLIAQTIPDESGMHRLWKSLAVYVRTPFDSAVLHAAATEAGWATLHISNGAFPNNASTYAAIGAYAQICRLLADETTWQQALQWFQYFKFQADQQRKFPGQLLPPDPDPQRRTFLSKVEQFAKDQYESSIHDALVLAGANRAAVKPGEKLRLIGLATSLQNAVADAKGTARPPGASWLLTGGDHERTTVCSTDDPPPQGEQCGEAVAILLVLLFLGTVWKTVTGQKC